jgi:hypothetical protein
MGAGGPGAVLKANSIVDSPLKNMIDENLVFPRPPDDIINKRAYPTFDLMWERGLSRQNGRWRMGGGLKANLIVVFFSESPLKNMMDGNLVFPCPPNDIINKRAYPTLDLLWVRVLSLWNGRWMTGGSTESHLIVVHLFYSPLKNMIGQKK